MKLVVKNSIGETMTLQVTPQETFVDLKRRVEYEAGISLDLEKITTNSKNIIDTQKVIEYFRSGGALPEAMKEDLPDVVCAVPGCSNTKAYNDDKVFFAFPQEKIRPLKIKMLKRAAVPCINPELPAVKSFKFGGTVQKVKPKVEANNEELQCRLCSQKCRDYIFIYGKEGRRLELAEKINERLNLNIKMTDHLPKQVCGLCIEELNALDYFAKVSTDCQEKLMNDKIKVESVIMTDGEKTTLAPGELCENCPLCSEGSLGQINTNPQKLNDSEKELVKEDLIIENSGESSDPLDNGKLTMELVKEDLKIENSGESSDPLDDDKLTTELIKEELIIENSGESSGPLDNGKLTMDLVKEDLKIENSGESSDPLDDDKLTTELIKEELIIENSGGSSDPPDDGELTIQTSEDEYYPCGICGDHFNDFNGIMQHCSTHFEDGYYYCSLCEESYPSHKSLVDHFIIHKPQKDFVCESCKMAFKDNQDLIMHICDPNATTSKCKVCFKVFCGDYCYQNDGLCDPCRRKQNGELKQYDTHSALKEINKCNDCGKVFSRVSSLTNHQRKHQETNCKPYACKLCAKRFIRKGMLMNHVTSYHRLAQEVPFFTCEICCEAFPNPNLAISHMESRHAATSVTLKKYSFGMPTVSRLYTCEFCEKHFAKGSVLNKHRETHVSDKPYCCKYCSMTFTTFAEQSEHKSTHLSHEIPAEYICENTIPTKYLCKFCERCFVNYITFMEHQTIHYGCEPYHCSYCNLKFATLDKVTKHRLSHGGQEPLDDFDFNRPYQCPYCSKSFTTQDALVKHIRMHTGEKPFICDQCGRGFSQSSGLNTHKKFHSDIRPYSCPHCPRTFKIKAERDNHIRKHSGERPYKCEFCGKTFMTQHVYSQHRKIHTGERPYKCDVCGHAFSRSHVLTVHSRIHTGEKPYICDICCKSFRQKSDMLKHRRKQHSNQALGILVLD